MGFHANRRNIVALRFAGHRTIKMLGLGGPEVGPFSNCTQQVPTLLWFHANGRNKSQHFTHKKRQLYVCVCVCGGGGGGGGRCDVAL